MAFVSVGGESRDLVVTGTFVQTGVVACTMQLYFQVTVGVVKD
jgi:hypothetical protein